MGHCMRIIALTGLTETFFIEGSMGYFINFVQRYMLAYSVLGLHNSLSVTEENVNFLIIQIASYAGR